MPPAKKPISPRRAPKQSRSKDLVEDILKSATRVLVKSGLAGFNTNKVAEVAGVSIGSLYQYFPNKEALLSTLIKRKLFEDQMFFQQRLADSGAWSAERKFRALIAAGIELHRRDHSLYKVIFEQMGSSDQMGLVNEMNFRFFELVRSILASEAKQSVSHAALRHRAYLIQQLILGIWHSQADSGWAKLESKAVEDNAILMIAAFLSAK